MPRKTKQEKIIADLRRKLILQEKKLSQSPSPKQPIIKAKTKPLSPKTEVLAIPTELIKKDLLKTLILTIVAISLELVVYLIWP